MELIFPLEDQPAEAQSSTSGEKFDDGLTKMHMAYLLRPSSAYQQQVLYHAQQAHALLNSSTSNEQEPWNPAALAAALAERGHTVWIRQARGGGSGPAAFKSLPACCLVVAVPAQHLDCAAGADPAAGLPCGVCPGGRCGAELIVDANFRSHFLLARGSSRYQALVELVPAVFVGPACQLEHLVDWLSREMEWSFKARGETLPPWRRKESLMSRWLSKSAIDTPVNHPAGAPPSPTSPHTPTQPAAAQPADLVGLTSTSTSHSIAARGGGRGGSGGPCSTALPALAVPCCALPARPAGAQQAQRRVYRVPLVSSISLGAALGEAAAASEALMCGASPDSPTMPWACSDSCASPLSVLAVRALPFARGSGAASCARGAGAGAKDGGEGTAHGWRRRAGAGAGALSLLTLQLARAGQTALVAV